MRVVSSVFRSFPPTESCYRIQGTTVPFASDAGFQKHRRLPQAAARMPTRVPPPESSSAQRRANALTAPPVGAEEESEEEASQFVGIGLEGGGLLRLSSKPESDGLFPDKEDPSHLRYGDESVCAAFRSRVGWLGLFLIGLWSAAFIIDAFEHTLQAQTSAPGRRVLACYPPPESDTRTERSSAPHTPQPLRTATGFSLPRYVAPSVTLRTPCHSPAQANVELAHFVPLIIGQGGNAGSQAVSSVIRALAGKEIDGEWSRRPSAPTSPTLTPHLPRRPKDEPIGRVGAVGEVGAGGAGRGGRG